MSEEGGAPELPEVGGGEVEGAVGPNKGANPGPTVPSSVSPPPTTPASPKTYSSKIDVLLKPAGNAPILKKKKWQVDRHKQIAWISEFIRKFIRTETEDSVFVYVNQSFSPSPDTEIGTLFDCFGSDGKLVIYYCRTQAWG